MTKKSLKMFTHKILNYNKKREKVNIKLHILPLSVNEYQMLTSFYVAAEAVKKDEAQQKPNLSAVVKKERNLKRGGKNK